MSEALSAIRTARRRSFFGRKPMYEQHALVSDTDLDGVEAHALCRLPLELREMLVTLGYGDLNDELSFRREWWHVLEVGQLKGHVVFAQDDRGNLYTFAPDIGAAVHYIDRFDRSYALLASSFEAFLRGLVERNFEVVTWAESLAQEPYAFSA